MDGKATGRCERLTLDDGSSYAGDVVDSVMEGRGHLLTPSFDYTGALSRDLPHGFGTMRLAHSGDGVWLRASWLALCAHCVDCANEGDRNYAGCAVYTGTFSMGKRDGYGILELADGTVMCGAYEEGLFREGVQARSDACAAGTFAADCSSHGHGATSSEQDGHFVGAFERGLKHCDKGRPNAAGRRSARRGAGACGILLHRISRARQRRPISRGLAARAP